MISKKPRIWALAMNSVHARILCGLEQPEDSLPEVLALHSETRKLRDIMADKPGRSFSSGSGGRRSSIEYASDPVEEDRHAFVRQVLDLLETHRATDAFDKLVVFAEHEVLGDLRHLMPKAMHDMVMREVPKNLMHHSARDLYSAIVDDLKNASQLS